MKPLPVIAIITFFIIACTASVRKVHTSGSIQGGTSEDTLRFLYSLPADQWPAPFIDSSVKWQELGVVPGSPLKPYLDSLQHLILLGKTLFFDPRLSGSNKISCASCHIPELSWTDGRVKSIGHDQQLNKRNSPGLQNVWVYKRLFWDGRSNSLEDQAFSPINSETEMHSDMGEVMMKLRRIPGYRLMFDSAFRRPEISPETVTTAIAAFQRTLVSQPADFDRFLSGNKNALSNTALRGLHLFRTKARCINCHNGPLFTDNDFHNTGLTYYQGGHEDMGRYNVTHKTEDIGRFKTPSLRDVIRTRPWMHNGLFDNINSILDMYSAGMPAAMPAIFSTSDSLLPKTDRLIHKLDLTKQEKDDIIAFLHAITGEPMIVKPPVLPK